MFGVRGLAYDLSRIGRTGKIFCLTTQLGHVWHLHTPNKLSEFDSCLAQAIFCEVNSLSRTLSQYECTFNLIRTETFNVETDLRTSESENKLQHFKLRPDSFTDVSMTEAPLKYHGRTQEFEGKGREYMPCTKFNIEVDHHPNSPFTGLLRQGL